jgi:hypothetical protein
LFQIKSKTVKALRIVVAYWDNARARNRTMNTAIKANDWLVAAETIYDPGERVGIRLSGTALYGGGFS